jgi:hypothetical protein
LAPGIASGFAGRDHHAISNRYYFTMFVAIGFAGFHGECGCGRIQDPITTHFGKKGPAA